MTDQCAFAVLDNTRQNGEAGELIVCVICRQARVCLIDLFRRCFGPWDLRSVDGFLDLWTVKIDFGILGQVTDCPGKAEDVPEQRTRCCDLIDIETLPSEQLQTNQCQIAKMTYRID